MTTDTVQSFTFVKGANETYNSSSLQNNSLLSNNRGDALVAQSLPPYAELVRLGKVWSMRTAAASAFNAVAALPTTLATAILHNGESGGGKSYVILDAWCNTLVSTAAAGQLTLIAQVTPSPLGVSTAPTHSAATTILTSRSGRSTYDGLAKRAVNVTTFFADGWDVIGAGGGHAAANIAAGVWADVGGRFVVPPGGSFGLNVVSGTVSTAGLIVGCTWAEVQLTLGG